MFLAEGRLGNQIFQYVFIKSILEKDKTIITSGFDDLLKVFEISDVINLSNKNRFIRAFLFRLCKPMLDYLSKRKIISSVIVKREAILEEYRRESTAYELIPGLISGVTLIRLGHFQSESFFSKDIASHLKIKELYIKKAAIVLNDVPAESYKIFIHIRRGDYEGFKIYGQSTLLPMRYYKEQIEWFSRNKKGCYYIFLSDDPGFVKKEFSYINNKIVSTNNDSGTDLALMTLCDGAILSPSSFGWWGSYLMKRRDVVFAPEYWLGFKSKIEFHKNATPSYATKIDVRH